MILRRFMEHVREQNWLAVFIDVLVVFGSVVLATQISAGIERARADQQLRAELESVTSELKSSMSNAKSQSLRKRMVMDGVRQAIDVLSGDSFAPRDPEWVYSAIRRASAPQPLQRRVETLRGLQNSGRLKDVPYEDIAALFSELLYLARTAPFDYDRHTSRLHDEHLQFDFIEYSLFLNGEMGWWGGNPITAIDWAAAKKSPTFRRQLLESHTAFTLLALQEEEWQALCLETLEALEKRGFSGTSNWFIDNKERIYDQFDNWEGWLSEQERDYLKDRIN